MKCSECGFDNTQTDICSQCNASLGTDASTERLRKAVNFVLKTFKDSEQAGYRSRDRQFAIEILDKAMDPNAPSWQPTDNPKK